RLKNLPGGQPAVFLKAFAEGGGSLSRADGVKLVRQTPSGEDVRKILRIIEPIMTQLRKVIRGAVGAGNNRADPLPFDKNAKAYQALVQIGYACKEDGRLRFRLREQLGSDDTLDF